MNLHELIFTKNDCYTKPYIIEKNKALYFIMDITYINHDGSGGDPLRADGPFDVVFQDIRLDFSTTE